MLMLNQVEESKQVSYQEKYTCPVERPIRRDMAEAPHTHIIKITHTFNHNFSKTSNMSLWEPTLLCSLCPRAAYLVNEKCQALDYLTQKLVQVSKMPVVHRSLLTPYKCRLYTHTQTHTGFNTD